MVFLQPSFLSFSFDTILYKTAAVKMLVYLQMKERISFSRCFNLSTQNQRSFLKILAVETTPEPGERGHESTALFMQVLIPAGDQPGTFWGWLLNQGRGFFKHSRNILLNSASVIEMSVS